jgi:hypothetical protein
MMIFGTTPLAKEGEAEREKRKLAAKAERNGRRYKI